MSESLDQQGFSKIKQYFFLVSILPTLNAFKSLINPIAFYIMFVLCWCFMTMPPNLYLLYDAFISLFT